MRVGYALTSKKKESFLKPTLISHARSKGISFVSIDPDKPLLEQGPFDIVLHKWPRNGWREAIEDYKKRCPEVIIVDHPDAIRKLQNRHSMQQMVGELGLSDCNGKVGIPRHLSITKRMQSISQEVAIAGMKLPLVVKPLVVDGTAKSHELFLVYDELSLPTLEPPMIFQQFINHGGILFKIFVIGETIQVVRRSSLPNITKNDMSKMTGVIKFPRVSSAASSVVDADLDPTIAEYPPTPLLEKLARELRQKLGLHLFNIDMIREHGTKDVFYVIDINYFPGYGKIPDYENNFVDFLLSLAPSKGKKRPLCELTL